MNSPLLRHANLYIHSTVLVAVCVQQPKCLLHSPSLCGFAFYPLQSSFLVHVLMHALSCAICNYDSKNFLYTTGNSVGNINKSINH